MILTIEASASITYANRTDFVAKRPQTGEMQVIVIDQFIEPNKELLRKVNAVDVRDSYETLRSTAKKTGTALMFRPSVIPLLDIVQAEHAHMLQQALPEEQSITLNVPLDVGVMTLEGSDKTIIHVSGTINNTTVYIE
jgi:hypothetical protein